MAMADWDRADSLFRFVHVRAPDVTRPPSDQRLPRIRTYFPEDPTPFHAALQSSFADRASTDMIESSRRFVTDPDRTDFDGARWRGTPDSIDSWLWSLDDYLVSVKDQPAIDELEKTLVGILGASETFYPDNTILWPAFRGALDALWRDVGDSVIAAAIWPLTSPESQALLMRVIRLISLLNDIVALEWSPPAKPTGPPATALSDLIGTERVRVTLLDGLVLLPTDVFPLPTLPSTVARDVPAGAAAARKPRAAVPPRLNLSRAADDLSRALRSLGQSESRAKARNRMPTVADAHLLLSAETMTIVRSTTGLQEMSLPDAISVLDRRSASSPGIALASPLPSAVAAMRILNGSNSLSGLGLTGQPGQISLGDWSGVNLTRAPVVGDLLVVQQELLRYEAGEIADIENVLAKERKLQIHQFKEMQEQESTITTEHEEDRTHDNQTTDRQELSQEASRQVQTQISFGAGANVSAQWGPVAIAANVQFSYATSSAESNRSASTFSKEVVDRSVETVKDRRIEQRRSLRRQKLLDRSEHELKNETSDNVVGIYQWVEKVYEAATFNYGRRMMLDVTVPEPALYIQFSQALATAAKVSTKPPPALEVADPNTGDLRELKPEDIGDLVDVTALAATYRVRGLKPPPPRWMTASLELGAEAPPAADKQADQLPAVFTKADYLTVPANYTPFWYKATVNLLINYHESESFIGDNGHREEYSKAIGNGPADAAGNVSLPYWPAYSHNVAGVTALSVGPFIDGLTNGLPNSVSHIFSDEPNLNDSVPVGKTGDPTQAGSIPVSLSVLGSPTYTVNVTLVCERTDAAYKAWQLEQYEAVVTAWEAWNQEFETAVRTAQSAAASRTSYPASTNSALADSQIATEMRRLFLQMLEVPGIGLGGATTQPDFSDPANPVPPAVNMPLAATIGRYIQFVEQAFEWPQITYRLYPYYWKSQSAWPAAISLDDANPAFADFLRAGSARVVVPVRPGFEIAVCSHLGIKPPLPWVAGKPPIIDADPYISIAEEIKSSQTSLITPVRIDTPWIVRLPTTLVRLKDDAQLPVFRAPTPTPAPHP
jgi:hypothetical protein